MHSRFCKELNSALLHSSFAMSPFPFSSLKRGLWLAGRKTRPLELDASICSASLNSLRTNLTASRLLSSSVVRPEVIDAKDMHLATPNSHISLSPQQLEKILPEGLPRTVDDEFEFSNSSSILLRPCIVNLISKMDLLSQQLRESSHTPKRRHFLLDGPPGSGKTFALLSAVLWARAQGWLVLYVPRARDWVQSGVYYRNTIQGTETGLWDTPTQAKAVLQNFLASHKDILATLPIQSLDPILLGEGAGLGPPRGPTEIHPEPSWNLLDLVQLGISNSHSSVSVAVRLRSELSHVTSVPVIIAVDEYNSWFTLSQFYEATGARGRRQIHASEIQMVSEFRPMVGDGVEKLRNGFVLAATSESIGVGKLPAQLPGVPRRVRFEVPRLSVEESVALLSFYKRGEAGTDSHGIVHDEMRRLFYLTNGNASEMRKLSLLLSSKAAQVES